MKPTLFILAAGMGSRYGGLKQIDGLGPNGETIMDYSVFDALRAGFGKIVFVIRKDFEADFREKVLSKYADKVPCEVCFQSIDNQKNRPVSLALQCLIYSFSRNQRHFSFTACAACKNCNFHSYTSTLLLSIPYQQLHSVYGTSEVPL